MTTDEWSDYLDPDSPDPSLSDEERAVLERARRTLAEETTWNDPPAALGERILRDVHHSQRLAGEPTAPAPPDELSRRRKNRRWVRPLAGLVVAATVAAIAFATLARGPDEPPPPPDEVFVVAGTALAPEAVAQAEVWSRGAGDAITLTITDLPSAPDGTYYSAWLSGPGGTVPVGSFHWRKPGGPIELWSGVDTSAYPEFMVTLQREGMSPMRSKQVVLTGTLER